MSCSKFGHFISILWFRNQGGSSKHSLPTCSPSLETWSDWTSYKLVELLAKYEFNQTKLLFFMINVEILLRFCSTKALKLYNLILLHNNDKYSVIIVHNSIKFYLTSSYSSLHLKSSSSNSLHPSTIGYKFYKISSHLNTQI